MKATMRTVSAIGWIAAVLAQRASVRSGSLSVLRLAEARPPGSRRELCGQEQTLMRRGQVAAIGWTADTRPVGVT